MADVNRIDVNVGTDSSDDRPGSAMIYDKFVEIVDGGPSVGLMVKAGGELIPNQRRVIVDSGMNETTVEIELVHLPTLGEIHISGYLIDEADFKLLQAAKEAGFCKDT